MTQHQLAADVQQFERHRDRLFGIAYRMLGSVEDAEDVVQESYLRWDRGDPGEVRSPEAWLVAVATRLAIDRLRRAKTEREHYASHWLPEPIATTEPADRRAEVRSDLSVAFLLLLERLAPDERAAFLLRDVFEVDYGEIARVLERSEAACRQMVHRARTRVRTDQVRVEVTPGAHARLLERFLTALGNDDPEAMLAVVADDATWTSDGGGKVPSTRRIVRGAGRIVRLVLGFERKGRGRLRHELARLNGEPAVVTYAGDRVVFTTSFATDGERLTGFYRVLNPDKLRHAAPAVASRSRGTAG